ncbi:hypothetical protein BX616_000164 [Lobosporangium transversale]|uniref:Uncharacterized protein n=1 Tax=Lobosporangium transversale TaxID=64571 RepID=A0A1Y2GEC9_9FUNG|nr:hypothetical protein BCR41DRAFT_359332 [Lobosporangium transversale]KAF9908422.1 hypothetical protein BX616_000164 [Lobosporangium transversale]ORZ08518.1 hypothetical protein BCR41DRAFT_359332 [Lobosporangium transversale]|eukprot:XP_021878446.1 hypothetical protein BCR41DRAFT_359332 [Lobosporangium transversale]
MAGRKPPTDGLTTRHVIYLVVMHMIGAMILDGGINFGLATAMYKNGSKAVKLWPLPQTLAGDAAVTIIIQQALTWILDRRAVGGDLKKGLVAPLKMPKNAHPIIRWFVGLEHISADVPKNTLANKVAHLFRFHGPRIAVLILATFILYWPITIGILSGLKIHGVGKDYSGLGGDFNLWPLPEIFKGVYGFAVGLTTPFVSYIALIYEGETVTEETNSDLTELSTSAGKDIELQETAASNGV